MSRQWVEGKHKGVIWKNKMTKKDIALEKHHEEEDAKKAKIKTD
tara:strand:- start:1307 stop:1438 length:132 start_codon:yes stop_codon:yes gene_type:complete